MRTKTRWHRQNKARSPEEIAGVLAVTAWRIAVNGVREMEAGGFFIDLPERTLAMLTEQTAFLVQLADRLAFGRLDEAARQRLVGALALRLTDMLADNYADVRGAGNHRPGIIECLNRRLAEYSELAFDDDGPGYDMYRFIGSRVADVVGEGFAAHQVIEVQAPAAAETFTRTFDALIR